MKLDIYENILSNYVDISVQNEKFLHYNGDAEFVQHQLMELAQRKRNVFDAMNDLGNDAQIISEARNEEFEQTYKDEFDALCNEDILLYSLELDENGYYTGEITIHNAPTTNKAKWICENIHAPQNMKYKIHYREID